MGEIGHGLVVLLGVAAGDTPSEVESLARKIVEHIRTHDLQPGDRLPSMQALADRFAVANPTVREALRRLQATGEVELRQGSGTYVGRGRRGLILANPNVSSLGMTDLVEIMTARLVVEPNLAGLAAEEACAQIERAVGLGVERIAVEHDERGVDPAAAERQDVRPRHARSVDRAVDDAERAAAVHVRRRSVSDTVFCQGRTRADFVPIAPQASRSSAGPQSHSTWSK